MNNILLNEVRSAEEKLKQAMLNSDTDVLSDLLAEDLIFTNHLGQRLTREDDLSVHASGQLKIQSLEVSDEMFYQVGTFTIVNVRTDITGTYGGEAANGQFRFTRIWLKKNGKLQVKAAHSCLIA
ncbi:nuclear transport factor 2 family protein [Photobacterium galatheae]|uniref:Cytochrome P450 n=1 Tax=Photobacterium galatheae TaxID=1654360 RepID=A0A066S0N8_9GAMM|nr:nuclear transport factor 2 family protein [Photobacterium galatheae]KDM93527.1 cytochrome P450 [Photobacterium galatheae]MCM0151351.1 nuclear transport factor 2 family protein [Photobacterium galatheae]